MAGSKYQSNNLPIALAITGASGVQYGLRLLQCLLDANYPVYLLISNAAQVVIETETDLVLPVEQAALQVKLMQVYGAAPGQLRVFGSNEWTSPTASGLAKLKAMVVCPCSGGSLSAIACGASNNLIERSADVFIKERRQLILVTRETPLSDIHLENMLKLSRLGVTILPASPGFYQHPESIADLIDFVVARILAQLGIDQDLLPVWGEKP